MEFFSQSGQDSFLLENFFRGKRRGVFVDVGAYDGVTHSNSLFFERSMNWSGLCIEPLPAAFDKLALARRARCVPVCVSDFEGEAEFAANGGGPDDEMRSALRRGLDPAQAERLRQGISGSHAIMAPVRRLSDVLAEQGLHHIDYCSIDAAGAEMGILSELDLARFDISVFTVANDANDPAMAALMAAKGYDLVTRLGQDDVYCRRGVKRLARTSVICAVWHGDANRDALLRGHVDNLARQNRAVTPIYVFDGDARPPDWFDGQAICVRTPLTIYQAWNAALSLVDTPLVMNLNLDDRLAIDAVDVLEGAVLQSGAAMMAGDWKICFSQAETDAVERCYPATQLPVVPDWPPAPGTVGRLGSGTGQRGTLGPAAIWRMDAHIGAPRYPWRFNDGTPIAIAGDAAWWNILANHLRKKILCVPLVIGNYHSHPGEQAEFRPFAEDEGDLIKQLGPSLL